MPTNYENEHWALIVVFFDDKVIIYYDSYTINKQRTEDHLLRTLLYVKSILEGRGETFVLNEWKLVVEPVSK